MIKKIISLALCLAFIFIALPVMPDTASAADGPTTSITVTKYAPDGTTVVSQQVLNLAALQALPVQGDGSTHYFMQGPTFDNTTFEKIWDPDEIENLKDKGAVMGTDVKDLCELVGGAVSGDQIEIRAIDGYGERFAYEDVYNPEPEQGKFVACWYTRNAGDAMPQLYPDGANVPAFADGIQLVFMAQTTNTAGQYVFGHWDMHETLPEINWHHYYQQVGNPPVTIDYPSANGLSIKWISAINIYQEPVPQWSINVTGIVTQPVDQGWFENALACHGPPATWTDGSGNVWSGLPLWYLCGLADDTNIHGIGAFNDAVAAAGYTVEVRAIDDYFKTFASADVARNSGYIVANQMNGAPLPESNYPLRLVGSAITSGGNRVGKIASINLLNVPVLDTFTVDLIGADTYTMTQAEFNNCAICHGVSFVDTAGTYSGVPLWLLCGWVDDTVQHGLGAFDDALASNPPGYGVKVNGSDEYYFSFDSADVARNNGIIVANKLDGADLPDGEYPLRLIGDGFAGGSGWKVREIISIVLEDLPVIEYTLTVNTVGSGTVTLDPDQAAYAPGTPVGLTATPAAGWTFTGWSGDLTGDTSPATVTMDADKTIIATFSQSWNLQINGMKQLTLSQADFEAAAAANPVSCVVTNKDGTQDTYSGVAYWRLVGLADDADAATMNSGYAAMDYKIYSIASDGFGATKWVMSTQAYGNDTIIMANKMNGNDLPADKYPLRLVSEGAASGWMVSKVVSVEFVIPWDIDLFGALTATVTNTRFETEAAANPASWTDTATPSNTWSGTALWRLVALVDDADPSTFNDALAAAGYSVKITATDTFNRTFASADIARNEGRLIASKVNGWWLLPDRFPARFVGPGLSSGQMVSKIDKIELLNMPRVITASAGAGGSITPSGDVIVPYAGNQIFTITPDTGYHIVDVVVDGVSQGVQPSVAFGNVVANHTISASFSTDTFVISASCGANGYISPAGDLTVNYGADQTFTITPNAGCQIVDVLVDGQSVGAVNKYIFTSVNAHHTISASFVKLLKKFIIDRMNVDFRRPNNSDTIYLKAQVVMPAGVTFKPATDAVNLNIDGFIIDIPAGSFKSTAWWWNQSYTYKSKGNSGPVINITWNCQKCEFILTVRKANVDVINNYDGVAITLRVGSIMGFADIDMFIDSLSYPANR